MEITALINHPERMNRDTLYELRSVLALHPYFQTVRLLMLQNLYLLHDSSFDEELRRATVYVTDRKVIFQLVEAAHYQLRNAETNSQQSQSETPSGSRTVALIDSFLDSIPQDDEETGKKKRPPTPADAAIDYVSYLLESEAFESTADGMEAPQMKGQSLIDNFLEQERGRIHLDLTETYESSDNDDAESKPERNDGEEEYFTETLARIYIKQGRYQKALDIIVRLSQKYPQKNTYFNDQIRFLEKLVINNNIKNKK